MMRARARAAINWSSRGAAAEQVAAAAAARDAAPVVAVGVRRAADSTAFTSSAIAIHCDCKFGGWFNLKSPGPLQENVPDHLVKVGRGLISTGRLVCKRAQYALYSLSCGQKA
jgi:hypothetical protein